MLKSRKAFIGIFVIVLTFVYGGHRLASEEKADEQKTGYALGAPREDLDRFYGIYGDDKNPGRDFFVAPARSNPDALKQIPPGYLMVGAMWGDVAPWYLKSVGDTRFEQQWVNPGAEPLIVVFEAEADGKAVAMRFEGGYFEHRGRLVREDGLPEKLR